jgi:tRNA dimethylallyltransferase
MQMPVAIFLMGPTASGKTTFALEIAKQLPVEIISVDSAGVYRGLDIGTGKPTVAERAHVPHHLIDIRDPAEPYSAAEFMQDALKCMDEITKRRRIPLLVGGTMLYFRALQEGLSPLPSADPHIRAKLLTEAKAMGWAAMHKRLATVDPKTADRIHPNDVQRIQRALEVYEITQKPLSAFFEQKNLHKAYAIHTATYSNPLLKQYRIHSFALATVPRATLHQNIERRFYQMLDQGLVLEVEKLFKRQELDPSLPAMRAVGYRQVLDYLVGKYSYEQMINNAIAATRQLAKRQLTWLRSLYNIEWLENNHLASLARVIHCPF